MSATNFKTENNTYRKLIGNGLTYRIPRFQRDYSWTDEEWEDLWTDILGTIQSGGEPAHYMGYLVLQSQDEKTFDVIDGQQRLTTLSLIGIVRYILCQLEHQHSGQDYDFDSDAFNIEHVLPQNPETGWEQFSDEEVDALVYRIGNMVLLAKGENKSIANASYITKRPILQSSCFGLTRKLGEDNIDWTPERIAARQKTLAKLATAVWRIDQLS